MVEETGDNVKEPDLDIQDQLRAELICLDMMGIEMENLTPHYA
jgi:hypothetical protein